MKNARGPEGVHQNWRRHPGPVGKTQKAFEEVARLPRSQQDKIVEALVDQFKRKAS